MRESLEDYNTLVLLKKSTDVCGMQQYVDWDHLKLKASYESEK